MQEKDPLPKSGFAYVNAPVMLSAQDNRRATLQAKGRVIQLRRL